MVQLATIFAGGIPKAPDWTAIVALSNEQLITAELRDQLERSGVLAKLPPDLQMFLNDVTSRTKERNSRLSGTLREALAALNSAGVEPVLLKGCATWARPGLTRSRIVSDLDLMVRPAETAAAVQALSGIGFNIIEDLRDEDFHKAVVLGRPQDVGSIDLHQHAPGPASASQVIDLHGGCDAADYCGCAVRLPSPEMQLLVAVLHDQFQDGRFWRGGFDLRHLLDIADIARLPGEVDWRRLKELCPTPIVRTAMISQLLAAKRMVAADIPDWVTASAWGALHYWRQRAQYIWPALNVPFHTIGFNKGAWMRLSSRMMARSSAAGADVPAAKHESGGIPAPDVTTPH